MLLLVRVMGAAPALAGIAVTLLMLPAGSMATQRLTSVRKDLLTHSDARIKLTTEVCETLCGGLYGSFCTGPSAPVTPQV